MGPKQALVMSATVMLSWLALLVDKTGAYVTKGKCILGYGTKLVWNSVRSTLRAPSNLSEAVMEDTILTNESVEIVIGWSLNIEVPPADVIDGLIVHHEGA